MMTSFTFKEISTKPDAINSMNVSKYETFCDIISERSKHWEKISRNFEPWLYEERERKESFSLLNKKLNAFHRSVSILTLNVCNRVDLCSKFNWKKGSSIQCNTIHWNAITQGHVEKVSIVCYECESASYRITFPTIPWRHSFSYQTHQHNFVIFTLNLFQLRAVLMLCHVFFVRLSYSCPTTFNVICIVDVHS